MPAFTFRLLPFVILNACLILLPSLLILAHLIYLRNLRGTKSTSEISGASGELNIWGLLLLLSAYFLVPNVLLSACIRKCRTEK